MIVVLNGPLGVGKSTLAEALTEGIDGCAMIGGDALVAVNPPHANESDLLHSAIAVLVEHHQRFGYRHFVIEHYWAAPSGLGDLQARLADLDPDFRCFRLTLPLEENIERIRRRAEAREIDELDFEVRTVMEEREALSAIGGERLGRTIDVSLPPARLVERLLTELGLGGSSTPRPSGSAGN